jgi:Gpi18-like mannosyltransferase
VKRNALFIVAVWLCSRVLVFIAAAWAAPHAGWQAFDRWDGAWYGSIATHGYEYVADGKHHNTAFFPLFPLIGAPFVHAGLPWPVVGTIVNNVAFFAAFFVVFDYVLRRSGVIAARWSVATLAFLPLSLFGSVAYSEGIYILCSALTLRAFDRKAYASAGIFGLLSSAARPFGVALAAGLLVAAVVEKRGMRAVAAAIAAFLGIAAYALYCAVHFGDALAFVHTQAAWRAGAGFDWRAWSVIARFGFEGRKVVAQLAALVLVVIWWRRRRVLDAMSIALAAAVVAIEAWAWSYDATIVLLIGAGGLAALLFRDRIGIAALAYVVFAFAMVAFGGTPFSVDRNAFALVPIIMSLGLAWERLPSLGLAVLAGGVYGLATDAAAFAAWKWVA